MDTPATGCSFSTSICCTITDGEIMQEISRITTRDCFGCSANDPIVRNYNSAHYTLGCLDDAKDIIERNFDEAMFNLAFKQIFAALRQKRTEIINRLTTMKKQQEDSNSDDS